MFSVVVALACRLRAWTTFTSAPWTGAATVLGALGSQVAAQFLGS